ncbi:mesocentin [Mycolicibacterium smegmatis]|uniref:Mesocentin n=1 Tax=Mycolicibacterium smegmatis (strain ATCC 700084 / mc(2)155) TaxID=246196 RepID=A0R5Y5_MYCS2|nr:mesocentin [Mycolicibacterium smegmatis]ABK70037.1 mesocentin [Mycolicibacterium smegmatis MC2 155]AIU11341.1 mesocentin [Mycolicibacterium smegmatis MC2 155]AIU17965.1 mesocentin [Mycolicibacterium smegmatis]AIU24589.1 mesocentin [Mycolicibacterium smegmatis]MCC3336109.1 mesocentin [Mycolicibacterium smegmatis]
MRRLVTVLIGLAALVLMSACGSGSSSSPTAGGSDKSAKPGAVSNPASNAQYCAQNRDPRCPKGSYHGTHVLLTTAGGYWDASGNPIDGGPMGADGSTGNNHTQEYCARNEDPGCPMGSYVAPDAIKNPDGSPSYVVCEGTICTNPNHGAADPGGFWDANGNPIDGGPMGADGSTGNNHTQEYCARNEDPGCPMGSYVAPDAIKNPDGSPSYVVCEGTICTNPNHGAADPDGDTPASDEVTGAPDDDPPAITPAPDTDPGENSPRDAQTPDQPALPEQQPDDGDAFDPGSVDGPGDEPNVDEP